MLHIKSYTTLYEYKTKREELSLGSWCAQTPDRAQLGARREHSSRSHNHVRSETAQTPRDRTPLGRA